jgi:outer membrane lipoprotein-sorting protein
MRLVAAVVLLAAASSAFAYTAEELAAKNVAAKGGAEKLAALQSVRLTGKLLVNGDTLQLGYVATVARPDSVRIEATLQGLTLIQAYDGTEGWKVNPLRGRKDPEKMSADDAKELSEDAADFTGALVDYQAKGYKLDYLGTEDVDGTDAYKLRVTRPNGDVTYVFLDPDYFLEIRTISRRIQHGVPRETVTDYGDYEQVNGVYYAFSQASGPNGSSDRQKVQFDKAEANTALDGSMFRFPAVQPATAAAK